MRIDAEPAGWLRRPWSAVYCRVQGQVLGGDPSELVAGGAGVTTSNQADETEGWPRAVKRADLRRRPARRIFDRLQGTEGGQLRCPSCRKARREGFVLLQDADTGGAWICCTSGCSAEEILRAIGLSEAQLLDDAWPRPTILTAADLDDLPPSPPMLIGNLVRQGSGLLIHGKTSLGKTYLQLEMARALLVGGEWMGIPVQRFRDAETLVLYLCRDWLDQYDFRDRLHAVFGEDPARHRVLLMTAAELEETEQRLGCALSLEDPAGLLDLIEDAGGDDGRVGAVFMEPLDQFRRLAPPGTDAGENAGRAMAGVRRLWGRLDLLCLTHEDRKAGGEGADTAYGSVKIVNRMPCALRLLKHEESGFVLVETSKPGRGGPLRFFIRFNARRGSFERVPDAEAPHGDLGTTRQRVVSALKDAGDSGATYDDLAQVTGLSRRALTSHVGTLKGEDLVRHEKVGRCFRFFWIGQND